MIESNFSEIAGILVLAAVLGSIARLLRQPVLIAFIVVGVLVGPVGLGWVTADNDLELLAKIGVSILLFLVGLRLDVRLIRSTGPVAVATGLGQVVFTTAIGYIIALALGLDIVTAFYVAIALCFSSTIIIIKLLSDKREIDELHGRIAVGFLIVQDIIVVLLMIGLTASGEAAADQLVLDMFTIVARGVAFLVAIVLMMRFVLPPLLHWLARSRELVVLFAIAWAISLAALGDELGFSEEVGAFLAGIALASTSYKEAIGARLVSLRDFLLLFFFINLGAQLDISRAGEQLPQAVVLSVFVLIGNPVIVMVIMGVMGYRKRVSFLAGLAVAQISEFSLILAALGLSLGHIDTSALSLITAVGLVTIGISSYMILYSHHLYRWLEPYLGIFERREPTRGETTEEPESVDVVLYGLGRYGGAILSELIDRDTDVLAVDFDPQVLAAWGERGVDVVYGDAEDVELVPTLPLHGTPWVVSTIPRPEVNAVLVHELRAAGYDGRIAATAHREEDAELLELIGVDHVLRPFADAAQDAAAALAP